MFAKVLVAPVVFLLGLAGYSLHQSPILGASNLIPTPVAIFSTSLQSAITSTQSTMNLVSASYNNGTSTLASSSYAFILDEGTAAQEFVNADCTGTSCANMTRGLDFLSGTTSIPSLRFAHRRGASVKITDAPILLILSSMSNGATPYPNVLSYGSTASTTFTNNTLNIPSVAWVQSVIATATSTIGSNFLNLSSNSQTVSGNNTYSGVLTFTGKPALSAGATFTTVAPTTSVTPSGNTDIPNKAYVDGVAIAGAPIANNTTTGIARAATSTQYSTGYSSTTPYFIASNSASSTASSSAILVSTSASTGKIDTSFLNGSSENYTFNGNPTFTATTTLASTTIIGSTNALDIGKHIQVFTSNGTFSVPTGIKLVDVELIGGGGGGEGRGQGESTGCSNGAGGGAYVRKIVDVSGTTSISVIVGAGAVGTQLASTYGTGSSTSFGNFLTAVGGSSVGGVASGGTININGYGYSVCSLSSSASIPSIMSMGGGSFMGRGSALNAVIAGTTPNVNGASAATSTDGYGSGGGGVGHSVGAFTNTGGTGSQGIAIIHW